MRFPSLSVLAERAAYVLRRFPWTLLAGAIAATAAIVATTKGSHNQATRLAFVAALGLPATIALALLAETRGWRSATRLALPGLAFVGLAVFYAIWPGIEIKHEAITYVQLSAALHLAVAFLPFVGVPESVGFWQYNRRMFLGFLRAGVFSAVLFVGVAIALGALDHLFGVKVPPEAYARVWLVTALVVNTWMFLATVPQDLAALAGDTEYPRALKVFTQYILTPLAFSYLVILLAYLVKIVAGAEWPSGWIGWLVASVSVTGLLGFLLVHPLRSSTDDAWIRTYARWLFIGLIPAAVMLLVAFWKRIVPYGLTEPRVLGIALGIWLLVIALLYTVRPATSIRLIPVTLSALLLITLYGPLSLRHRAVVSQAHRLSTVLPTDEREASAALRFLMDHRDSTRIAAAVGHAVPSLERDSLRIHRDRRDSLATAIMATAGKKYVPEYWRGNDQFYLNVQDANTMAVAGYDWAVRLNSRDTMAVQAGADTVRIAFDSATSLVRVRAGADTLRFDLAPLARFVVDSGPERAQLESARARIEAQPGSRAAALELSNVSGSRDGKRARVTGWTGWLLLGR